MQSFIGWLTVGRLPSRSGCTYVVLIIGVLCFSANAIAQQSRAGEYEFNIPRQNIATALTKLATQTGAFLLFPYDQVQPLESNAVIGKFKVQDALQIMLRDTGLQGGLTEGGVITISLHTSKDKGDSMKFHTRKSWGQKVAAAFLSVFSAGGAVAQDQKKNEPEKFELQEIVVTATKRATSLQDTSISISAIGAGDIDRREIAGMNDYLRFIPGVSMLDRGVGLNGIVVRGVTSDTQNEVELSGPSVGVYFGEVPLSGLGMQGATEDLQMVDIERVEVLRGPQGTLFGSSALSGVVRNIPVAPDLETLQGRLKTGYSNTAGFGGDNNKVEGVLNLPLIENVLAVRAVAYRFDNSGYVKNTAASDPVFGGVAAAFGAAGLVRDQSRVGDVEYTGGRVTLLWRPLDELDVTLQHVVQHTDQYGQPRVSLNLDGYRQNTLQLGNNIPGHRHEEQFSEMNFTNMVVEYDLGWGQLLSSTLVAEQESETARDLSSLIGGIPVGQHWSFSVDSFIQELRFSSQLEGPLQYLVGLYYENIDSVDPNRPYWLSDDLSLSIFGTPLGPDNPLLADGITDTSLTQKALFGEISYDFTEQLELTLGGRWFDYDRETRYFVSGIFAPAGEAFTDTKQIAEKDASYKVNLSFQPDDDRLFYAQWAEGFRLGNTNEPIPDALCDVNNDGILDGTSTPITDGFDSDTLENFELGAKLSLFDKRMTLNTSIYRINWDNLPLSQRSPELLCSYGTTVNAGKARSQGIELDGEIYLSPSLRMNFGASYVNAELQEDAPSLNGVKGDRLPGAPEYNMNLGLEYEFSLGRHPGFIRGDYAYVGGFYNNLQQQGFEAGDYGQLNMSMGVNLNRFNVEIFAHNLTNEDAVTWVGTALIFDATAWRLKPRTLGLNITYQF